MSIIYEGLWNSTKSAKCKAESVESLKQIQGTNVGEIEVKVSLRKFRCKT